MTSYFQRVYGNAENWAHAMTSCTLPEVTPESAVIVRASSAVCATWGAVASNLESCAFTEVVVQPAAGANRAPFEPLHPTLSPAIPANADAECV